MIRPSPPPTDHLLPTFPIAAVACYDWLASSCFSIGRFAIRKQILAVGVHAARRLTSLIGHLSEHARGGPDPLRLAIAGAAERGGRDYQ
jgi:hypothetical protein